MPRRPQKLAQENRFWIGVTYGMRGWFAILYERSPDGGYIDVIYSGIGSYPTPEGARIEAEEWSIAEGIPTDFLGNENQQENQMADKPNPIPVKRLLNNEEFSQGDTIRAIRGKIKKLFSNIRKGGDGDRSYEYQDGIFVDSEGTEIKITFSKCTQSSSAVGKSVYIRSKHTEHGTKGMTLEEYEGKRSIKVTPSAEIEYEGGGGGEAGSGRSSSSQSTGSGPGPARSNVHPKDALRDMIDCHKAVSILVNENYKDATEEFRQGSINTIFIECAKQGIIHDFTKRYTKKVHPPAPKDPSNWKECVIPTGTFEGKTLADLPDDKLLELFSALDSKGSNTDFAECVYQAARDRKILPEPERSEEDQALDPPPEDDIPF